MIKLKDLRNGIIVKPSYMSQNIVDNNLVRTRKNIVTLTLDKPVPV